MKTSTVLGFAVVAISAVSAKVVSECTTKDNTWILVRDGLANYKKLGKAGDKKVSFLVNSASLAEAKPVAKKFGERAVVWELSKDDLKKAKSLRKNSKKLKVVIKNMLKEYKNSTGKKARFVVVPKGTDKKVVKAFEKRHVSIVRAANKATSAKKIKKLLRKAKKNEKAGKALPGGIIVFKSDKKDADKKLRKLRKALNFVNAKKCFKRVSKNKKSGESASGSDSELPASEDEAEGVLKVATVIEDIQVGVASEILNAEDSEESASEEEVEVVAGAVNMAVNEEAAVDNREQAAVVGNVEQAAVADNVEQAAVVGNVEQAAVVGNVEQAAVVGNVEQAAVVNNQEQAAVADNQEQAEDHDSGDDADEESADESQNDEEPADQSENEGEADDEIENEGEADDEIENEGPVAVVHVANANSQNAEEQAIPAAQVNANGDNAQVNAAVAEEPVDGSNAE